jgi:hypothetical protein
VVRLVIPPGISTNARLRRCAELFPEAVTLVTPLQYDVPVSELHGPADEQRGGGDFEIGFLCLFCGQLIAEDAPDFAQLDVTVDAGFASFTCHVGCFRAGAHDPSIFPDLEKRAERPAGYVEPDPDLLRAGAELADVLAQLHEAELASAADVRSLASAVTEAAERHGIVIEPLPLDEDE